MDPIESLMHEHRMIERMLNVLNEASRRAETSGELDLYIFEKAVDFIKTFADRCHHMKEEGEFFPLIERKGIPNQGGPIGMMLHEHDIGRGYVRGMEEALRKYKAGDKSQTQVVIQNARGYANLLAQHIMKEDNILYPMGNRVLTEADRKKLAIRFEEIEEKEIGEGVHEEYHHMVEGLETRMGIAQE